MLNLVKQPKYLQKTVKLPNGYLAVVVFELVERDGQIIAKAVSLRVLNTKFDLENKKPLCLPGVKSPTEFIPVKSTFSNIVADFAKDFSFTTCLVTRAPNLL